MVRLFLFEYTLGPIVINNMYWGLPKAVMIQCTLIASSEDMRCEKTRRGRSKKKRSNKVENKKANNNNKPIHLLTPLEKSETKT